jgi:hypothetical protein
MTRLPLLKSLRAFEAAGRHLSFTEKVGYPVETGK